MGKCFSKSRKNLLRIAMLGLDGAGKTSILYRLKTGQTVKTIPTIGFNVETLIDKNVICDVWDIGGIEKIRSLYRCFEMDKDALIYVIDSTDAERLNEAKDALEKILMETTQQDAVVLIIANKQDKPNARKPQEIEKFLTSIELLKNRTWYVQGASAITGEGLKEGLDWLKKYF